jgi:hypothetical protein
MPTDLVAIGEDLHAALVRRVERRQRRRRRAVAAVAAVAAASALSLSAAAIASGVGGDLQLDPTKWSLLGGGSVDNDRGAYVHAKRLSDGSHATFLVEHDADMPPYAAFLLHERTLAAAEASSPVPVRGERGDLCAPSALARAELVAIATLRVRFPPGADADATKSSVDASVQAAFAGAPCRGLEYAGEQARLAYAGVQPASMLMPGAR